MHPSCDYEGSFLLSNLTYEVKIFSAGTERRVVHYSEVSLKLI